MATREPLTSLVLSAASIADDLGFVALADLSQLLGDNAADCRVIGGHMVTALAARWQLGPELYRETGDADLGLTPVVARDQQLPRKLKERGYEQIAGNRFARTVTDIPIGLAGPRKSLNRAIVDVLIPAYTGRARQNVKVSEDLVTTEVPGLAAALNRHPVTMRLELRRLGGELLVATLPFPDEASALVLKSLATQVRSKTTDVADIWRCLEIAAAASVPPAAFSSGDRAIAATIVRSLFARRDGTGMTALADDRHLSQQASDESFTRISALIRRVLGPAPARRGSIKPAQHRLRKLRRAGRVHVVARLDGD
jgi:hypothetical protein